MSDLPTSRLIFLLRGADREARVDAARQLAARADETAAHAALYEASFSEDARLRQIAARALPAASDDRTLIRLADLLHDRRQEVRLAAAETLRDLNDPGATLPLIEALTDSHRWVTLAAVEGLQRFGGVAALRPLRQLIASPDSGISQAARMAVAAVEARAS